MRSKERMLYNPNETDPHKLGETLVRAVFEAFITVFKRKTAIYIRLATNGPDAFHRAIFLPIFRKFLRAKPAGSPINSSPSASVRSTIAHR